MKETDRVTLVHVSIPTLQQIAYIKAANKCGSKLSPWVEAAVDAYVKDKFIAAAIQSGVSFSDFRACRTPEGVLEFNGWLVQKICLDAGLPQHYFDITPDRDLEDVLISFYLAKKQSDGPSVPGSEPMMCNLIPQEY